MAPNDEVWAEGEERSGDASLVAPRSDERAGPFAAEHPTTERLVALGTLAAGVAHQLNDPLTYMLIELDNALRRLRQLSASLPLGSDPVQEDVGVAIGSLSRVLEGAQRVQKTVRDLTVFSQGDVAHRSLVHVRGVLESAIQLAWHEIHHRARLTRDLSEVPPVEANEARLAQVFLCLLLNAVQAIPDGRADENEVRVVMRADGGDIVIDVADTGVGIADDALARIFDPFFTTKGAAGASGLGLSFAFGTARSMGGDLRVVESPGGRGTTFRLTLPAARAHRLGPSSGKVRAAAPRKRMLLVEDETFVREALVQALSEQADVVALCDAREALEHIGAREDFDLVLCDLMMPLMTGMDLYVEIVRSAPHLAKRVVFMTGGAFTPAARAFLDGVSNPCLAKPLDMDRLRSLLGRA